MYVKMLLPVVALALVGADAADDVKKDVDKLQGTWQTASLIYNGKDHDANGRGRFRFIFKGDEATVTGNDAIEKEYARLKFKLDPSTMPKCVDITVAGGVQLNAVIEGIYEVKGDELRLCARVFGNERPLEFASPDGSSVALLVMKRVP